MQQCCENPDLLTNASWANPSLRRVSLHRVSSCSWKHLKPSLRSISGPIGKMYRYVPAVYDFTARYSRLCSIRGFDTRLNLSINKVKPGLLSISIIIFSCSSLILDHCFCRFRSRWDIDQEFRQERNLKPANGRLFKPWLVGFWVTVITTFCSVSRGHCRTPIQHCHRFFSGIVSVSR